MLDFLRQTHCELLYLVGDIIDRKPAPHVLLAGEPRQSVADTAEENCREADLSGQLFNKLAHVS